MNEMWRVYGMSGCMDDDYTWSVAIYSDEESAKLHAKKAREFVVNYYDGRTPISPTGLHWEVIENPYDPDMKGDVADYTYYYVEKVSYFHHFDQFQESRGMV